MHTPKLLLNLFFLLLFVSVHAQPETGSAAISDSLQPGYFRVNASRNNKVFFYTTPDTSIKRKAFLNSKEWVFIQKIQNGFGYTVFINSNDQKSSGWLQMRSLTKDSSTITATIGSTIKGNFSTTKKEVFAFVVQTKPIKDIPNKDAIREAYTVFFSDEHIKPIEIGCCDAKLINEGDLNNDGKEDITIYQAPENGCTYSMQTYSFQNGNWKRIVPLFLIPTACDALSDTALQKMIFKVDNSLYFYDTDPNSMKLIKKKVIIK